MLVNWVSYVFPPNFISRRSTYFPVFPPFGLLLIFSNSLVSIPIASVRISSWSTGATSSRNSYTSSDRSMSSSSFFCLRHQSWWWRLLGQFFLGLWWCCHLVRFPYLMGTHISPPRHMPLLQWFPPLIHFGWCHHGPHLHGLMLSHFLQFGVLHRLCIWLVFLGSTKKLVTP